MLDFEIIGDIQNLSDWDKPTIVVARVYGNVNGEAVDETTKLVSPKTVNTYNELSSHITTHVIQPIEDEMILKQKMENMDI